MLQNKLKFTRFPVDPVVHTISCLKLLSKLQHILTFVPQITLEYTVVPEPSSPIKMNALRNVKGLIPRGDLCTLNDSIKQQLSPRLLAASGNKAQTVKHTHIALKKLCHPLPDPNFQKLVCNCQCHISMS